MNKNLIIIILALLLSGSFLINIFQKIKIKRISDDIDMCKNKYSCLYQDLELINNILLSNKISASFFLDSLPKYGYLISLKDDKINKIFFNSTEFEFDIEQQMISGFKINVDSQYLMPCYNITTPPQGMDIDLP